MKSNEGNHLSAVALAFPGHLLNNMRNVYVAEVSDNGRVLINEGLVIEN